MMRSFSTLSRAALLRAAVTLCLPVSLPGLALAQALHPMTGAEFDQYTQGQTFYYGAGGTPYGGEEYLEDHRVRWSFLDGKCQTGHWYQQDGSICFIYDAHPEPQCWKFFRTASGLLARFQGSERMTELYEVEKSAEPLMCLGPDVGA